MRGTTSFSLREAIETVCFRRLAERLAEGAGDAVEAVAALRGVVARIDAAVAALRAVVNRMRTAAKSVDFDGLVDLDLEFHRLIIAAGDNALFDALYETLHAFTREEIRRSYRSVAALKHCH